LDQKRMGICGDGRIEETDDAKIKDQLEHPTDARVYYVYDALKKGWGVEEVYRLTKIDRFFLEKIANIVEMEGRLAKGKLGEKLLREAKRLGFSDAQLARLVKKGEDDVRDLRKKMGVIPTYKMVDTCAAEFEAKTPYYYSTYESENEAKASDRKKVIILGAGPIRIGQGVEFDYCTVHAVHALRELGYEAIIINNNPETVSTDFDTSDKLYFEPLTIEDVLNIVDIEDKNLLGIMVQFGGQTAINMAKGLSDAGVKILGTQPDDIDLSEDRDRFGKLLKKLGIPAPEFGMATSFDEAVTVAEKLGYPVLARPSYVLGGRAMEIVFNDEELEEYMRHAAEISPDRPIRIDKFLDDAVEIDVDAISDGKGVYIGGIMEHIEEAGIHSGDACCVVPPQTLGKRVLKDLDEHTKKIALSLKTIGLINLQYAVKDGVVYVIEANQRSSRTIPFISKATGVPMANIAARAVMGESLKELIKDFDYLKRVKHVAVKEVVLPFDKLRIDPILSPEMRSTGESMGIDRNFGNAYYKAQTGAGLKLPDKGNVFVSVSGDKQQNEAAKLVKELERIGFDIYATEGTADAVRKQGVEVKVLKKVHEGSPNAIDMIQGKDLHFVINVPKRGEKAPEDEKKIRFAILDYDIPYVTTMAAARAAVDAIKSARAGDLETKSLNEYFK